MNSWKIYALLAAFCNASVGIISKGVLQIGYSSEQIAFYKCLIAFILLTLYLAFKKNGFSTAMKLKKDWMKIAICAIFGVFVLYHFETTAYVYTDVATVVFILLGGSAVVTGILTKFFLKEKLGMIYIIATGIAILGLYFMFSHYGLHTLSYGTFFALMAGAGYGTFLVLTKKFNVDNSGFEFIWWLVGFGTLYLSIPFMQGDLMLPTFEGLIGLVLLSIIPTIGGFYCTIKALSTGRASGVQLFELSEPVFASIFAFIAFSEILAGQQLLGALLILFAIYLSSYRDKPLPFPASK